MCPGHVFNSGIQTSRPQCGPFEHRWGPTVARSASDGRRRAQPLTMIAWASGASNETKTTAAWSGWRNRGCTGRDGTVSLAGRVACCRNESPWAPHMTSSAVAGSRSSLALTREFTQARRFDSDTISALGLVCEFHDGDSRPTSVWDLRVVLAFTPRPSHDRCER